VGNLFRTATDANRQEDKIDIHASLIELKFTACVIYIISTDSGCDLDNNICNTVPQVTFRNISLVDVKATDVISFFNSPGAKF
jgi:adenine C2-methylase RlmN of 23S rRNA A2503 and tRNA A37